MQTNQPNDEWNRVLPVMGSNPPIIMGRLNPRLHVDIHKGGDNNYIWLLADDEERVLATGTSGDVSGALDSARCLVEPLDHGNEGGAVSPTPERDQR